jgi:HAD superfamily hydrolase (TIGR01509 family)
LRISQSLHIEVTLTKTMANFDLIIFDCDGVLVDSEAIANEVLAGALADYGIALAASEARAIFAGLSVDDVRRRAGERFGILMPENWSVAYYARLIPTLGQRVMPIDGVGNVLRRLSAAGIRYCVASQGPIEKVRATLTRAEFWGLFEGHVYSAKLIGRPKPAPDLFLHAAASERAHPSRCAVIEDSVVGVQAGVAAGMRVFAYCARDEAAHMESLGAMPFFAMTGLPALLELADEPLV